MDVDILWNVAVMSQSAFRKLKKENFFCRKDVDFVEIGSYDKAVEKLAEI